VEGGEEEQAAKLRSYTLDAAAAQNMDISTPKTDPSTKKTPAPDAAEAGAPGE
jgi:hypothetical protein